jgi:nicotinamidase/pyrazinamidase
MSRALIVVDIQNDFLPGGALAVAEGDTIIPFVAGLMQSDGYDLIVVSQDWHPHDHGSFASAHTGASPFGMGELAGRPQMLWPDHCVQSTLGARLNVEIEAVLAELVAAKRQTLIVKKGQDRMVDSYSAFFDNARQSDTGLNAALGLYQIREVDVVGLAFDYCVKATALDAASLGFQTRVLLEGTRAVDPTSDSDTISELSDGGVVCVGATC